MMLKILKIPDNFTTTYTIAYIIGSLLLLSRVARISHSKNMLRLLKVISFKSPINILESCTTKTVHKLTISKTSRT